LKKQNKKHHHKETQKNSLAKTDEDWMIIHSNLTYDANSKRACQLRENTKIKKNIKIKSTWNGK
jgi:hypothetical protein